jgi:hypothetical protein
LTVMVALDAPGQVVNTVSVTTTNNAGTTVSLDADLTTIEESIDKDGDGYIGIDDPFQDDPCRPDDQVPICDRDNDGLTNLEEDLLGTNPDNPDTDGDGVLDGADPAPLDPCIPNANTPGCPTGEKSFDYNFYLPDIRTVRRVPGAE